MQRGRRSAEDLTIVPIPSLARPGGNFTGLTFVTVELASKRTAAPQGCCFYCQARGCPLEPEQRDQQAGA
jgi:hypothetical protein